MAGDCFQYFNWSMRQHSNSRQVTNQLKTRMLASSLHKGHWDNHRRGVICTMWVMRHRVLLFTTVNTMKAVLKRITIYLTFFQHYHRVPQKKKKKKTEQFKLDFLVWMKLREACWWAKVRGGVPVLCCQCVAIVVCVAAKYSAISQDKCQARLKQERFTVWERNGAHLECLMWSAADNDHCVETQVISHTWRLNE